MNESLQRCIVLYAQIDRRIRPHARYFMNRETLLSIKRSTPTYIEGPNRRSRIMGIPVEIDDSMPIGMVRLDFPRSAPQAGALRRILAKWRRK